MSDGKGKRGKVQAQSKGAVEALSRRQAAWYKLGIVGATVVATVGAVLFGGTAAFADVPTAISNGTTTIQGNFLDYVGTYGIPLVLVMLGVGFGLRWLIKFVKRGTSTV